MAGTTITLEADAVTVVITGGGVYEGATYDKLDGWYGIDNVDTGFVPRPGAPGAFAPVQTFPGEKAISIEGDYFGADRADGLLMRETLSALYNGGKPIRMTVEDDLRTTSREVHVASVAFPWTVHPEFEYTIDMLAADPYRYGATVTLDTTLAAPGTGLQLPSNEATGVGLLLPSDETPTPDLGLDFGTIGVDGRITITNDGNAETVTVFTVDGGTMADGFEIVNVDTGQRLIYLGPVSVGASVTLDAGTRTAFINGTTPAGRWLASPEWWSTPAKGTTTVAFLARGPVSGTPRLYAATPSAFA